MIKVYGTFKGYDGSMVRIYTDGKGHLAKIEKIDGHYFVRECDKYGLPKDGWYLSAETLQGAKEIMRNQILNYIY